MGFKINNVKIKDIKINGSNIAFAKLNGNIVYQKTPKEPVLVLDGKSYIDIPYTPKSETIVTIEMLDNNIKNNENYFGSTDDFRFKRTNAEENKVDICFGWDSKTFTINNFQNKMHKIELSLWEGIFIDGVQISSGAGDGYGWNVWGDGNLVLFAGRDNNSRDVDSTSATNCQIYSVKIEEAVENSEERSLIYDFVPAKDSNNVPCLFDKVTKTYFYNNGTGSFIYKEV